MPQTKFVTSKALALGLRPIVVLNKVDKPDAEPDRALNEVFDLFANLDADDDQLDFPHLYASGRAGWADTELDGPRKDLSALFDLVVNHVPAPAQIARQDEPFQMLATTLGADPFIGRILTGRVEAGRLKTGETDQGAFPQRRKDGAVPRHPHHGLPRPGATTNRRGRWQATS